LTPPCTVHSGSAIVAVRTEELAQLGGTGFRFLERREVPATGVLVTPTARLTL
jgi:hypothetical protein